MQNPNFELFAMNCIQVQRMIWFAINGSILVYVLIPFLIPALPKTGDWQSLELVFYLMGALSAITCYTLRRRFFSKENIQKRLATQVTPESLAASHRRPTEDVSERVQSYSQLSDYELNVLGLIKWSLIPNIVCWALIESIAVLGLVYSLLSGQSTGVLPFAVIALLLNLQCFPRLERLRELADMSRM